MPPCSSMSMGMGMAASKGHGLAYGRYTPWGDELMVEPTSSMEEVNPNVWCRREVVDGELRGAASLMGEGGIEPNVGESSLLRTEGGHQEAHREKGARLSRLSLTVVRV